MTWAQRLKRVFKIDIETYPDFVTIAAGYRVSAERVRTVPNWRRPMGVCSKIPSSPIWST